MPQLSLSGVTRAIQRILVKASIETKQEGIDAYLHAALNLAFSAFEAHINAIADDFLTRSVNLPGFIGGSVNGLRSVVVGRAHCSRWLRIRLVECRRSDGGCGEC